MMLRRNVHAANNRTDLKYSSATQRHQNECARFDYVGNLGMMRTQAQGRSCSRPREVLPGLNQLAGLMTGDAQQMQV
jgi:hypothetical protein